MTIPYGIVRPRTCLYTTPVGYAEDMTVRYTVTSANHYVSFI